MELEYRVKISLPDDGWDVDFLEQACWKAGREASRKLFLSALEIKDQEAVASIKGKRKGTIPHYLVTRFGSLTFLREKVKQAGCPLDKAIGLRPRQVTTVWVKQRACELVSKFSYRTAATLLSAEVDEDLSYSAVWNWVKGSVQIKKQDDEQKWEVTTGTKILDTVFDILDLFLKSKQDVSLQDIIDSSGLNWDNSRKIMSLLIKHKYVSKSAERGKYSLGLIYLKFAGIIKNSLRLRSVAMPHLIDLSKHANEPTLIAYSNRSGSLFSEFFLHPTVNKVLTVGLDDNIEIQLYCTAVGKILLAEMSEEDLQDYFDNNTLNRYTQNTITDINALKSEISTIRKEGIAFDYEEGLLGVNGIAAGVRNSDGKVIGSIGVVAPSVRLTRDKMRKFVNRVKDCALKISREMGFYD